MRWMSVLLAAGAISFGPASAANAQTAPAESPRAITVSPSGVRTTVFDKGERLVVLAEGLPEATPARVVFRQGRESELGRRMTTNRGTLRIEARIPADATAGTGTIDVIAGIVVASTDVFVGAVTTRERSIPAFDGDILLYAIGGIASLAVGASLIVVAARRKGRPRRSRGGDGRATSQPPPPSPAPEPGAEPAPLPADNRVTSSSVARLRRDVRGWRHRD